MVSVFIAGRLKLVCKHEFVFETHSNSYVVKRTSIKEIEDIFYPSIRLRITSKGVQKMRKTQWKKRARRTSFCM